MDAKSSTKSSVAPSAGIAGQHLPLGAAVQYYSRSQLDWVPAKVAGHRLNEGYYALDIQPLAAIQRVRPCPPGTDVYYWSTSRNGWIKAVVQGFDWENGVYVTDVQPFARPWMIQQRATEQVSTSGPAPAEGAQVGIAAVETAQVDTLIAQRPQAPPNAVGSDDQGAATPTPHRQTGPELPLASEFREPLKPVERRFKCPLCLEETDLEHGVSLDCDHKLCAECFGDYCSSKISEGRVMENELVCPATDKDMKICGRAITVEQVRGNIGSDLFDKFCQFRAANWVPHDDDGVLVKCPTAGCCAFMAAHGLDVALCPTCREELCTRCSKASHKGETCEQAAMRRKQDACESDKQFDKLLAAQGWMRCPTCDTPTELARGCYFMQCQSDSCRGRTHFCYLCGELLRGEDHMPGRSLAHFPRGPYNAECIRVSEEDYKKRMANADQSLNESSNPVEYLLENARKYLEF